MDNVIRVLEERGLVKQITHPEPLAKQLQQPTAFYIGFDATADSLHVGHLLPIMVMAHLRRAGHRPIALVGGGTAMIGDPSGKTEMRKMLAAEAIAAYADAIRAQIADLMAGLPGPAVEMVNNADWLLRLNYIDLLREVGVHFSVNRMLTYECFKSRMERGLSFIEFNYMILQAYDFLTLFRKYGCRLQIGGDDQWSNIIAGIDLIRRMEQEEVYGLTIPLLETADGKKMGKTEAGTVWLSPVHTSPYEFFQYWRNVRDEDVQRFLKLYTFLPLAEIAELTEGTGEELNAAKERLAFEVTKFVHGESEAVQALQAARALFAGAAEEGAIPTTELDREELAAGVDIVDLLLACQLVASKSEARRLIQQGGLYVNGRRIRDFELKVDESWLEEGRIAIRKGKKVHHRVVPR
ncbi:MAG: tyrosine--tRNA ligase [Firmicutes bacterium]|nr:tyrosine--tRNA ligase [Bacillota bacterium]HOB34529.1 tyrosine--tRNA ligase [Bacillota bacterium]HPZ90565.1 tyrosine--tRNA ligase [Bacillota bacterium]HQE02382.1 tyrosine--tRNA ligase [Bacillota bacterium]